MQPAPDADLAKACLTLRRLSQLGVEATGGGLVWKASSPGGTIKTMKHRDPSRHPGVMRFMRVDAEFAGILVAVGFVVMGVVGIPIVKWFLLGAIVLGAGVALLFRLVRKS
jgi:hypothetical protein